MNKKITLYELMGLVKDGQAPKRIKLNEEIYTYQNDIKEGYIDYVGVEKETNAQFYLSSYIGNNYISDFFNTKVEILEEEKKIEKITLLNNGSPNSYAIYDENGTKCELTKHSKVIVEKINEIIDEINKIKEKKRRSNI